MACKHPLKAFVIGVRPDGKQDLRIRPYAVNHLEFIHNRWVDVYIPDRGAFADRAVYESIEIPCGKCIGCRLEYSRQWANRCMLELQYHKSSYFVTLTYDDEHVPIGYYADPSTGEAKESMTLRKRDFQLFMKRLRKQTGQDLRFFMAGEYGSQTFRPHYHAIIFGLELDDLQFWKNSKLNYPYYNSPTIDRAWSVLDKNKGSYAPLGYAVVAPVSWETCAYTARYTAKKNGTQDAKAYEEFGMEPPFTLMSRRPGIARQYYDDHPDLFDREFINVSTEKGGRKFRPPKYFSNLYDVEYPEASAKLKEIRKEMAKNLKAAKLEQTDLTYLEYLEVEEFNLSQRIKSLERKL